MKPIFIFLFASSLAAQVQIGKNVQVGGSGGGGLSSFTAGNLPPLFTVSLGANPTTAPVLAFTLSSTSQNFFLAGPTSGAGVPSYRLIVPADIPTLNQNTSGNAATATLAANSSAVGGVALSGLCQTGGTGCPAGGSGLTGQTVNSLPLATSPTGSTISSIISQTGTTSITIASTGTAHGLTLPEGTPMTPVAANDIFGSDSGLHRATLSNNGGAASPVATFNDLPLALTSQPTPASTTFLQALNNAKNVPVHIAVFGDSFTVADHTNGGAGNGPLISTNRWAEQLRIQLQAIYGSHGTGVYPLVDGASTSPAITPEGWSCTGTFDTSTNSLGPTQAGGNTLVHMGAGATCTFSDNRAIPFTKYSVYYATPAGTSSLAIVADGSTSLGAATSGSATVTGVANAGLTSHRFDASPTLTAAVHTIVHTCTGDCYLYAGEGINGTTGVSVDLMGIGGATSAMVGATPTTELAFSDLIPGGSQAALLQDQTNDAAGSISTGTFSTNIQNFITHEQALASSPTVMLAIPPVDVINASHPLAPYTAIQTGLCASLSLTCINIQSRGTTVGSTAVGWGTTYISSGLWDLTGATWPTGNSGIHPSDAGSLDEFQMIYAALVNPAGAGGAGSPAGPNLSLQYNNSGALGGVAGVNFSSSGAGGANELGLQLLSPGGGGLPTYLLSLIGNQSAITNNLHYNGSNWIYDVNGGAAAFRYVGAALTPGFFELNVCPVGTAGATVSIDTACVAQWTENNASGNRTWLNSQAVLPTWPTNAAFVLNPTNNFWVDYSGNAHTANVTSVNNTAGADANVTASQTNTGTNGTATFLASTAASTGSAGFSFAAPGVDSSTLRCWGTGNGGGLPGVCGFFDNVSLKFTWSTNPAGDFFGFVPISNVSVGAGAAWSILHTGAASFASVTPTLTYSAAGTPLPTCAVGINGETAVVSDATAPSYMGAYTSGGAITTAVICSFNGTTYAWKTH